MRYQQSLFFRGRFIGARTGARHGLERFDQDGHRLWGGYEHQGQEVLGKTIWEGESDVDPAMAVRNCDDGSRP
jgi:hypothetical protein